MSKRTVTCVFDRDRGGPLGTVHDHNHCREAMTLRTESRAKIPERQVIAGRRLWVLARTAVPACHDCGVEATWDGGVWTHADDTAPVCGQTDVDYADLEGAADNAVHEGSTVACSCAMTEGSLRSCPIHGERPTSVFAGIAPFLAVLILEEWPPFHAEVPSVLEHLERMILEWDADPDGVQAEDGSWLTVGWGVIAEAFGVEA